MRSLLAIAFVFAWVTVCEGRPLLVTWPAYQQGGAPATKIVVYRNENGGIFRVVKTFTNLTATAYLDSNVKHNRTYCFRLVAQTADGVPSAFSEQGCGRPRK
jgi:hypothetical protein